MRVLGVAPATPDSEDWERCLCELSPEDDPHVPQACQQRFRWPWKALPLRKIMFVAILGAAALCVVGFGAKVANTSSFTVDDDGARAGIAPLVLASAQVPKWRCHNWTALEIGMMHHGLEGKSVPEERQKEVCLRSRGKHLDYVWTGGDESFAAGCGDCLCCWKVKPWELDQAVTGHMAVRSHPAGVMEEDGLCAFSEEGYDYPGGDIRVVVDVNSEKTCCRLCHDESACTSWTWWKPGDNHKGACALKSQGVFERVPKNGYVSGVSQGDSPASFQVQAHHGLCLDSGGELLHMWHCTQNNPRQQWIYDTHSGHLRVLGGGPCLHAPPTAKAGDVVGKSSCGVGGRGSQQWDFTSIHGMFLHLKSGLCLAPRPGGKGTLLELQPCSGNSSGWTLRRTWVPPDPAVRTFYIYRAQSDDNYPAENVNAGDLRGVMWYLHHEVVQMCPRKYSISRILRLKISMRQDQLGQFVAFDNGLCTVPHCEKNWKAGFRVGCQARYYGDLKGHWYSLPGACPSRKATNKTMKCMLEEPGGACDWVTGERNCTYHVEHAGEIRIDELTGIHNYTAFCAEKNLEYDRASDKGIGLTFWDGFHDSDRNLWRAEQLGEAFAMKYPHMPMMIDPPLCVR
mmetsp:Transcript_56816/g.144002  ORF Transcript_56816/g.144002 Transcript_56816/m.144002 type:complete len:625 (+) Transcript_56816:52-1926(+)